MAEFQFPDYVETFISRTGGFLSDLNSRLTQAAEHPQIQAREYTVQTMDGPVHLIVHRTRRSFGATRGEYRARFLATLPEELGRYFHGKEDNVNRFATLGALTTNNDGAEVGGQTLVGESDIDTTAGVLAAAIVNAKVSVLVSFRKALKNVQDHPTQTLSAWTELDFEQVNYDYAHSGPGSLNQRSWTMVLSGPARLSLIAVDNNPFWGGGLLSLLALPSNRFVVGDRPVEVNSLNAWALLVDEAPLFGGWCRDGGDFVFVSFAPNFLKGLPNFTDHLIKWASIRSRTIEGLLAYERGADAEAKTDVS